MKKLLTILFLLVASVVEAQVRDGTSFRLVPSNKAMVACTDPTSGGGQAAVTGTICLGTAGIYRKFSTGATDWILIATGGITIPTGTSGGVPYYSSTTTIGSSALLIANLPMFGGGAGATPFTGTRTGNTTELASWTGAKTSGDCVQINASGNLEVSGSSCGGGSATNYHIAAQIGDGVNVISTGWQGCSFVPHTGTITSVTLASTDAASPTSGSIVVDLWKDSYANFPPDNGDSITSATPPTISSTIKSQDTTLSSWGTSLSAGDFVCYNVDSVTTFTKVNLWIRINP